MIFVESPSLKLFSLKEISREQYTKGSSKIEATAVESWTAKESSKLALKG